MINKKVKTIEERSIILLFTQPWWYTWDRITAVLTMKFM
ncbi:hypothetical protein SAMN05421852_1222 [Thermoflavimicrobium dichotomicum]|uniref:Uncharacterized protein n=1 Tax=Thermoflavimicrobium dichotomicum TaxID=46223 RepID=A0A1I3U3E2_9BACL|nr:hypothetical protein SAMN05421852_1222 [Thermoflavimicrobium dichotomicum]